MYYAMEQPLAIRAESSERAAFIRRTYLHLAGSLFAMAALCAILLNVLPIHVLNTISGIGNPNGRMFALVTFAAFIGISILACTFRENISEEV